MMLGISPELTQAAFRVSDSAVNVCTPMFPFYPLLIMYCQKYCKQAGVGTLSSMMIPYTLALLVALTFVLYAFWGIGIPIGFDSGYVYPPVKHPVEDASLSAPGGVSHAKPIFLQSKKKGPSS